MSLPPINLSFSEKIAERQYILKTRTQNWKLTVCVGLPVQDVETVLGLDWRCPIQVIFQNERIYDYACGVDSFQALELAMNYCVTKWVNEIAQRFNAHVELFDEFAI
ncbi:DUF6968 family protein [Pseudoalteromonas xiamenensis]|uniref:DUF6968 family protein n=1 Tax=Pseudoalteromonas xiamenensis TaxID=882626 RepID=UPI0035E53140